ncbi:DUF4129 domain-containing protein [Halobacillus salinarum]|uniref:DUF4129 domain-containing protein n=1 Tax=Halobacillus salinarum TaxID=2932257 RepID=A0ABY4EMZ0_9BACI|nr:DUF4129 domain-containing protein [Halobacillus salinarum]UOQ45029.1 DUF4129 domain-containing protein [Halobacillus salinarum]
MIAPDKAEKQLKAILNQDEYQAYYEENKTFFDRIKEWIGDWVKSLFERLFPNAHFSEQATAFFGYAIGIIGVVLFVLVVLYLRRGLSKNTSMKSRNELFQQSSKLQWSFKEHVAEADRLEKENNLNEAARHLFMALLLLFEEKEWVVPKAWKTNLDYYEELQAVDQQAAERFLALAVVFDEVTYGTRTVTPVEYQRFADQAMSWLPNHEQSG